MLNVPGTVTMHSICKYADGYNCFLGKFANNYKAEPKLLP